LRGPWGPASRWWRGSLSEWDIVSESIEGQRLLLGEAKWRHRPMSARTLRRATNEMLAKQPPQLPKKYSDHQLVRVLFVPEIEAGVSVEAEGCVIVTGNDLFGGRVTL